MDNKAMSLGRIFLHWLFARRVVLLYQAAVFGFIFWVYALYGYPFGVAGYAALLGLSLGFLLAVWDFARFAQRHKALQQLAGYFPTGLLPEAASLTEADYARIIRALEAERITLAAQNDETRRDAEEYYTLWAHQIKTPLAAMRLLLQSPGGDVALAAKQSLSHELFRTEQYVDMVLQYQRLKAVQNDLLLGRHSLETLAKKAGKNCASLFIYKNLTLTVAPLPLAVVTDEKWFCFVLEQLYTNAVKYTQKGGVRVYAYDAQTLAIEDSGAGILPEDLPRVFERGFTGAIGRSERSSTGIGLYLCREALAKLGFGISLNSTLGKGTTVLLHLGQNPLEIE